MSSWRQRQQAEMACAARNYTPRTFPEARRDFLWSACVDELFSPLPAPLHDDVRDGVGAREEERARPRLPVEQLATWTFLRDCATTCSQYRADNMSVSVTSIPSRTYSRTLQASRHGRGLSTRRTSGRLTTGDSSARSPAVDARLADAEGSRL